MASSSPGNIAFTSSSSETIFHLLSTFTAFIVFSFVVVWISSFFNSSKKYCWKSCSEIFSVFPFPIASFAAFKALLA